jgi:protoporphyrinogen oxidase
MSESGADPKTQRCVIMGGGPGGLTAAYELSKLGVPAVVFEQDDVVGGISRTATYKGYRFDIGGHRFFTKVKRVEEMWHEIIADDMLRRPRLSRIYYKGKFFDYPLKPVNALVGLGPIEAVRIAFSYLRALLFPSQEERNLEQWVVNRFGYRLYDIFFRTYTEKVWGMPCTEIAADWAAQRIKNLDLVAALKNTLLGAGRHRGEVVTTLVEEFWYPRLGPGMMWERCRDLLAERGYPTFTGRKVTRIRHRDGRVESIRVRDRSGAEHEEEGAHFISSMPIGELLRILDPAPPPEVLALGDSLRYRDFLTVVLIVDRDEVFPDNWIYLHSPAVRAGRIQNFKNWSPDMVPDPSKTALGLEYFVNMGDDLWNATDEELVDLGRRECALMGLIQESEVSDGAVVRMPKAYPVYEGDYQQKLAGIQEYLAGLPNLQLIGRNGQHRYNNQDHSMLTAMYAAENIVDGDRDVWSVNVDQDYAEEIRTPRPGAGDRLVPREVEEQDWQDLIAAAFARYDPVALGGALAVVGGVGLFLATSVLLLRGGDPVGPTLSVLGNVFLGFRVTWGGAFVGLVEAGLGGFGFGYLLARLINAVIGFHERLLLAQVEVARGQDPLA